MPLLRISCVQTHRLVRGDAPGESRQKLSKLKANILSGALLGARHQNEMTDRLSQSDLD
jgi:hypothetical protein